MSAAAWQELNGIMMPAVVRPEAACNRLLAKLPARARDAFIAKCEHVELDLETVISQPGEEILYVYFPLTCYLSQILASPESALEIAMTGSEGMVGLPIVLGVTRSALTVAVQGSGSALRMSAPVFARELRDGMALRSVMGKYAHVCMEQAALGVACSRFHTVEQRLARWLLKTADRARSPTFQMTQRMLAYLMGVRRVGVTNAAGTLQERGLVRYTRGAMRIVDMGGLQKASCRCHRDELDLYLQTMGVDTSDTDDRRVAA